MLALGASHVAQNSDPSHTAQALKHRVAAMKLVKELLARPAKTLADGDALFGTLAILTCQSALIPDAMVEYMTLTRGANLVATAIMPDMNKSLFKDFAPERHTLILTRLVSEQPGDLDHIAGFRSSVRRLEPLCRTPSEVLYVGALLQIPDVLERSSSEGEEVCVPWRTPLRLTRCTAWLHFSALFLIPTHFSNDEWAAFSHEDNHVGQLLLLHMFLLDYVLGSFMIDPSLAPKCPGRKNVVISWVEKVASRLPPHLTSCAEWPASYCGVLSSREARHLFSP